MPAIQATLSNFVLLFPNTNTMSLMEVAIFLRTSLKLVHRVLHHLKFKMWSIEINSGNLDTLIQNIET